MPQYDIIESYRDDDIMCQKFYDFTQAVFPGIDFSQWHRRGFWKDGYIPFSIQMDGQIVSNVSITRMTVIIDGRRLNGIQFGTVGTIPEFRHRGLSRYLMEYVLDKYRDEVEFYFLFANETVLDFYPKFGFKPHSETVFKSKAGLLKPHFSARRLDINSPGDMSLIQNKLTSRLDLTRRFGAADYDFITLWHVLNIFPKNIFYVEEDDVIAIVTEKDNRIHLWDIIHSHQIDLTPILPKIARGRQIDSVLYYFPPDQLHFNYDEELFPDDSRLFVLGDFPVAGKKIKFPTTAQT